MIRFQVLSLLSNVISLDTSKDTEHEYPLPEPYETMSYHEPLIEAIEYLNTGTFYTTITMDYGDMGNYVQYTYSSPELFYGYDVDYQESYSIINKDGIAYEVLSDLDGNLYYLSDNPLGNYEDYMVDNLDSRNRKTGLKEKLEKLLYINDIKVKK